MDSTIMLVFIPPRCAGYVPDVEAFGIVRTKLITSPNLVPQIATLFEPFPFVELSSTD